MRNSVSRFALPMIPSYESFTREQLISRIHQLESKRTSTLPKPSKPFDFSAHSTRKIALKFTYAGTPYHGLAFQDYDAQSQETTPTVEGEIWKAVCKLKLVDESQGLNGCEWERCGRTDRGVSAAGQVLSFRVRSAAKLPAIEEATTTSSVDTIPEILYISKINRVLPPDIRIIAWSPVSPTFSARFNCQARHYKYFFSGQNLDISLMQRAASLLIGEHDFRNMCKIDPSKQLTHFRRRVVSADIAPVGMQSLGQDIHVFDLIGSAFLYHQVRHIMALLFLVGRRLEDPSIISSLLHTSDMAYPDVHSNVVDEKPDYQMADGLPLMLWDCIYDSNDVSWRVHPNDTYCNSSEAFIDAHARLERSAIDTTLEAHFLAAAEVYHPKPPLSVIHPRVPVGAGTYVRALKYVPLLERKRLEGAESQNQRWAARKGRTFDAKSDIKNAK